MDEAALEDSSTHVTRRPSGSIAVSWNVLTRSRMSLTASIGGFSCTPAGATRDRASRQQPSAEPFIIVSVVRVSRSTPSAERGLLYGRAGDGQRNRRAES